ncbi:Crinkler effector [Pleurotus pulmonarius]
MSESLFITHPSWREHNGCFHDIWLAWWGKSGNESELGVGNVVSLGSIPLKFIEPTVGRLTIREYHSQLFARLRRLDTYLPGGVVLSGQPGSGKTYTLLILLLKTLVARQPVLFLPTNNIAYYFSSMGVQSNTLSHPDCLHEFARADRSQPCTWALVNSDTDDLPPPAALVSARGVFIIQATAPRSSRYKTWVKQNRGQVWYMQRWSRAEILQALVLVPELCEMPLDRLRTMVDKAIAKWGWAPRDITVALTEEKELEAALIEALDDLDTPARLLELFRNSATSDSGGDLAHSITSLYQSPSSRERVIDFKSPYIRYRVQERVGVVHRDEALQFIAFSRRQGDSGSGLLGGWAFENLVFDNLCSATNPGDLFPPRLASASGTSWSAQIDPFPPASVSASGSTSPTSPSPCLTCITFTKTLDNVTLDDTKLYVPPQPDFPLLNAFFLQLDRPNRHVTVIVLQVTVSLKHNGSVGGYAFLRRLKTHLEAQRTGDLEWEGHGSAGARRTRVWDVAFEYRLVVPAPAQSQTFTWNFPGKIPDTISGPVYIQAAQSQDSVLSTEEDESDFVEGV